MTPDKDVIDLMREKAQYWPSNAERDAVIKHRDQQVADLTSENQRLRNALHVSEAWSKTVLEGQARDAEEITRLHADNERLREALREVMNDLTLIGKNHWLPVGLLDDVIYVNARAALEGK